MSVKKAIVNYLGYLKEKIETDLLGVGSGINIGATAGDISSPNDGDIWYNSSTGKFRKKENGTISDMDTGGSSTFNYGKTVATANKQNML